MEGRDAADPGEVDAPDRTASGGDAVRAPAALRLTSELELLISGALIFSLLQIPERLISGTLGVLQRVSSDLGMLPFFGAYLGSLAVILLTASFAVHFIVRSFWVALRGLNNVFPEGIEWSALDIGPISRSVYRDTMPSPRVLEERADRFASTIFSVLFYLLFSLVAVFTGLVGGMLALWALAGLLGLELRALTALWVVGAVMLAPILVAGLLDARYKRRGMVDVGGRPPRGFRLGRRVLGFYQTMMVGRLYMPIMLVFASRFSSRRTGLASAVAILGLVAVFLVAMSVTAGRVGFDSYRYLPDAAGAGGLDPLSYVDRRPADATPSQRPTIQSALVEGPYLELFVPFDVDRDPERLERACPDLDPLRREGLHRISRRPLPEDRERRLVTCLGRIYRVEVDGVRVRNLDPVLYRDPATGLRGVLSFVPATSWARGRHLLTVGRDVPAPPAADGVGDPAEHADGAARDQVSIVFWR